MALPFAAKVRISLDKVPLRYTPILLLGFWKAKVDGVHDGANHDDTVTCRKEGRQIQPQVCPYSKA
jgi:hypothetical protein